MMRVYIYLCLYICSLIPLSLGLKKSCLIAGILPLSSDKYALDLN